MSLVATCDRCERTAEGIKGLPPGWDHVKNGDLLCPHCTGSAHLPKEPHPDTGEPFTEIVSIVSEVEAMPVRVGPPMPPSDMIEEYDDDGEVVSCRPATKKERKAAWRAYEAAVKDFQRTQGVAVLPGQKTTRGRFRCSSGSWAEGVWSGSEWLWERTCGAPAGYKVCPRCEGKTTKRSWECRYCRGKGVLAVKDKGEQPLSR
jgi:hypothetical protein